jgi:GNAT superfamily N-acetyltransferase
MRATDIDIRPAGQADLEAINRVIEAALMTWDLPDRVKRLSLPVYRYDSVDLDHLHIMLAEDGRQNIIGIAAWEQADAKELPAGSKALSLHGIYVDPSHHQQGIGSKLFRVVEAAVCKRGFDGLLLKAQQGANGFFISQEMQRLHVKDALHQYANCFWKSAASIVKRPD